MRPLLATRSAFSPETVDKVERLLEVLAVLREDPLLGPSFVLHGGTALNVFADDVTRLSVDVDLMYVGRVDADAMRADRPRIDVRLREVMTKLGYAVRATNDEHSGRTYRLRYGEAYIKIDVSYLARVALLEPAVATCPICSPAVRFTTLDHRELLAGKVKAFMERVASRDLYDLARMAESAPLALDDPLTRALVVRAIGAADSFPALRDPVAALSRFADPAHELVESLRAVVAVGDDVDFRVMCERVASLLAPCACLAGDEAEYLRLLDEEGEYRPELLFAARTDVCERARLDPVMRWKVENLRKRPKAG